MSVSTVSSLMSIYNADGSLKTAQQWNADRASMSYSAAEQAQLDAVLAKTLAPYISAFAYRATVQGGQLVNDVDAAGEAIPANVARFAPSTLTAQQVSLLAQAKQQGKNPSDPTSLLDMLGVARTWSTPPAATQKAMAPNPAAASTSSAASSGQSSKPAYVSTDVNGKLLSPNITMMAPAEVGGGSLHTDAASVLYYAASGKAGSPVVVGSDVYRQLVAAGLLGNLAA